MIAALFLLLPAQGEPVVRVNLLENGSFAEKNDSAVDRRGIRPIPWWLSAKGMEQVVMTANGPALRTGAGEWAEQAVACDAGLAGSWRLKGRLLASGGMIRLRGGDGQEKDLILAGPPLQRPLPFEFLAGSSRVDFPLVPRVTLHFEGMGDAKPLWCDLSFEVDLPCPSPKDLRAEILELLKKIVAPWIERGLDDLGPRKTGFLCRDLDAVDGKPLDKRLGGMHPLWSQLLAALQVEDVPEWRAALERFLDDWLALGFDEGTGIPRSWDCEKDEPIADRPAGDLALPLGFLLDVAEQGPERFRDRARAAAAKIAATVLAKGVLPDGTIGSSYYPKDGRPNTSVLELRRFDLLAQLARIPEARADPRFVRASEELRSGFEFSHVWWGTWDRIDPGFDDEFGNYGARAASIALLDPDGKEGQAFRAIALEGWKHYAPIWRDALRLGGNVAADQVRCWNLLADVVRIDPSQKASIADILRLAARSHFKGEQYGNGAWGDVTIFRFGPRTGLQVGDYPGAPQNLLNGLATVYSEELGGKTDETRAMYTAVLRSSVKEYLRTYGFLLDRTERQGQNSASGSLRMLLGLVKMAKAL